MSFLARGGSVDISVPAGQSVVVGSYGPGQTKISTAAASVSNLPAVFALASVLTGGSSYTTYASATTVRLEASTACDVEYDVGAQPALTAGPYSVTTGLTAKAGGGQSGATALTGSINKVTTCATGGDSSLLPFATVGKRVSVRNGGAASMNVFPQTGESINEGAANAAFAVAAAKTAIFECVAATLWNATLSA